jgi:hypothetical protein
MREHTQIEINSSPGGFGKSCSASSLVPGPSGLCIYLPGISQLPRYGLAEQLTSQIKVRLKILSKVYDPLLISPTSAGRDLGDCLLKSILSRLERPKGMRVQKAIDLLYRAEAQVRI